MAKKQRYRPESDGIFQTPYHKNRRRVIAENDICAICGKPVDKRLRFPDPMSATVDHIIPIANGGHPSDIENLQLAHLICNQVKGTKATIERNKNLAEETKLIGNRELPNSTDWARF